jgi:hypothetical protein
VGKFLNKKQEDKELEKNSAGAKKSALQHLAAANSLMIRQQKEWGEILTGFETRNKYEVTDHWGNPVFQVEEESGGFAVICAPSPCTYFPRMGKDFYCLNGRSVFSFTSLRYAKPMDHPWAL